MSIYEVWMSDGNEFKLIAEQKETEFAYTINSNECKFEFKVRAKKEAQFGFSYGKFSEVLTLETEPATMENLQVKTVTDKCGVLVTWDPPKSSCHPISNYFFQVRDD